MKVDRQIVVIAKLHQCTAIYSDDGDIRNIAEDVGIKTISTWELSLPRSRTPLLDESGAPIKI